jgi:hypothetical protein
LCGVRVVQSLFFFYISPLAQLVERWFTMLEVP